jgi:hypothetical protein
MLDAAIANLLSPMVLFFVLGVAAGLAKSDLAIPEAIAKGLALYLMLAIGFKGGVAVAQNGLGGGLVGLIAIGVALSCALPFLAFAALTLLCRLDRVTAAATAAHYGSISIVTFVTADAFLRQVGTAFNPGMVAVAALMETPAIVVGLLLARERGRQPSGVRWPAGGTRLWHETLLNGSVVMLVGSFAVGWVTGPGGMAAVSPFIVDPMKGVLMLFLLDMGLVAARRLREANRLNLGLVAFGVLMPLASAAIAIGLGALAGFSVGDTTLLATLAASASYIAVPAAMRLALPSADPGIYITLSLAVTFPFNVIAGIPIYLAAAERLAG